MECVSGVVIRIVTWRLLVTKRSSAKNVEGLDTYLLCTLMVISQNTFRTLNLTETLAGRERPLIKSSITSKCTQVCGKNFNGKSCANIILIRVYPNGKPEQGIRTYAR